MSYDPASKSTKNLDAAPPFERQGRRPPRGRQANEVSSPDGALKAVSRGGHVYLVKNGAETQISKPEMGGPRIKHGQASWVYGEELGQSDAMGFSSDGAYLWFYRFDETKVLDTHLTLGQSTPQTRLAVEAYPKPGQPNPEVDLYVAETATGRLMKVPVRPAAFDDGIGHYVYDIRWRPSTNKLIFHRLDRRHKTRDICSFDPKTGEAFQLDRETNSVGWVEEQSNLRFLEDQVGAKGADLTAGLIISEASGQGALYQLDLEKGGRKLLAQGAFDIRSYLRVDLERREVDVIANSSLRGMRQMHRLNLATGQLRRITDPAYHHEVQVSPKGDLIVDRFSNLESPPKVQLIDGQGKVLIKLRDSDVSVLERVKYPKAERFTFTSADGKTQLNGRLQLPPASYLGPRPVLVQVYGGPLPFTSDSWTEDWDGPSAAADFGFVVVNLEVRGGGGRGRAFRDALYQNMGRTEIDDIASGIKSLAGRPRIDLSRVGIEGTSYGGYASLMAILRYPDLFHAAAVQSCVSDWRNYDTTYTERYMGVLPESKDAYDAGSAMTYAESLKGWLMIYYGTADDNTHPANSLQIIRALQRAGKSFEVQVGVDVGHSGMRFERMMEFFIERLVMGREMA